MSSWISFGHRNGRLVVAVDNEIQSGVFRLPRGTKAEDIYNGEGRIKYVSLPEGARKIRGESWLPYFIDSLWAINEPTQEEWEKAKAEFSDRYDDGAGFSEERFWIGQNLSGEKFPCRRSEHVGDY